MRKLLFFVSFAVIFAFSGCTIRNELITSSEDDPVSDVSVVSEEESKTEESSNTELSDYSVLEFRDVDGNVILDARDVEFADVEEIVTADGGSELAVKLIFNEAGTEKFTQATKNAAKNGTAIAIYVDDILVSNPMVSAEYAETGITGGEAIIAGNFSYDTAWDMCDMINRAVHGE